MDQTAINWVTGLQEYDLANIDSFSPTMVEARAQKDALYNSEENGTKWKWEERFSRTAPENDSPPAQVQQYHPGMCWQPDYFDSQPDPVCY